MNPIQNIMNQQGQTAPRQDYAQTGSIANDYNNDQQRKLQQTLDVMQERYNAAMTTKLTKVAELFELNVLSEEEALKACEVIIGQHSKKIVKSKNDE